MKKDCITEKEEYILKEFENGEKITVRDLQLEVLSVMDEIHRICEQHNITYFLIAGSALGCVNYKGFIPWDDDMDIAIPKKDWKKFIKALKKDLSDEFYFDCYETDKRYNTISGPMMKVRKRGTYIEEVNTLLKNRCRQGDGIFVDVIIYDNIAEKKWVDELHRTVIKLVMPFIVLFDNLHINPIPLKSFVVWYSNRYARKHEKSSLVSQPISVPWEKFLHEPVFKKEDVYPVKKYEFEGREFYSYNNIEKILKEWYGPNCLKKWDGKKWIETLPEEKRKPKHVKDLNLHGEEPTEPKKKKNWWKALVITVIAILSFCFLSYIINKHHCEKFEQPFACIEVGHYWDGGTTEYLCPGYKIIAYDTLGGFKKTVIGSFFLTYDNDLVDNETKQVQMQNLYKELVDSLIETSATLNNSMEYIALDTKSMKYLEDKESVLEYLERYHTNILDSNFETLKETENNIENLTGIILSFTEVTKKESNRYIIKGIKYRASLASVHLTYEATYEEEGWKIKQIDYAIS